MGLIWLQATASALIIPLLTAQNDGFRNLSYLKVHLTRKYFTRVLCVENVYNIIMFHEFQSCLFPKYIH